MNYHVFISHASEDKDAVARPLARALHALNVRVWLDEFELTLGDSLRRSIDHGLAKSKFGVVVLSPDFFRKEWPNKELDGLVAREDGKEKVILPVWHNVSRDDVLRFSPLLADKLAVSTSAGIDVVARRIHEAINRGAGDLSPEHTDASDPSSLLSLIQTQVFQARNEGQLLTLLYEVEAILYKNPQHPAARELRHKIETALRVERGLHARELARPVHKKMQLIVLAVLFGLLLVIAAYLFWQRERVAPPPVRPATVSPSSLPDVGLAAPTKPAPGASARQTESVPWKSVHLDDLKPAGPPAQVVNEGRFRIRQIDEVFESALTLQKQCFDQLHIDGAVDGSCIRDYLVGAQIVATAFELGGIYRPPGKDDATVWIGTSGYGIRHLPNRRSFKNLAFADKDMGDLISEVPDSPAGETSTTNAPRDPMAILDRLRELATFTETDVLADWHKRHQAQGEYLQRYGSAYRVYEVKVDDYGVQLARVRKWLDRLHLEWEQFKGTGKARELAQRR